MATIDDELVKTIRKIEIETMHLAEGLLAGAYRSAFKGRGIEFEDVREFQVGDEVRSIDWNVTAKMGAPYIKNFREERELTVMLVVDASSSTRFGSADATKSKVMAEIGALLSFSAIKNNDRVGLIIFSDGIDIYLSPKKGTRHVLRIIRELLVAPKPGRGSNINEALTFLGETQSRSCICFLISDFFSDDFSLKYSILAKKHDMIAVHVQDPFEAHFPDINLAELEDLETGSKMIVDTGSQSRRKSYQEASENHRKYLEQLAAKSRSGLIEIETDKSYFLPIENFFKRRGRH